MNYPAQAHAPNELIRFRRIGTKSWIAAVDAFNAAEAAGEAFAGGIEGVTYLRPELAARGHERAVSRAGFDLIQHPDRPTQAEPELVRLRARLSGERDPAWMDARDIADQREAVRFAEYCAAVRRRR